MQDILGFLPLTIFTVLGIMYHIGHNEYKKGKRTFRDYFKA